MSETLVNISRARAANVVLKSRHNVGVLINLGSCAALLCFSVGATIFAEISKNEDGTYPYNSFMIPCTVEGLKLVVSTVVLLFSRVRGNVVVTTLTPSKFFSYMLPALCYFVSNNCMFYIIRELGPTTFQIMNNLKVLATGLLMRFLFERRLTWLQWKALVLLVLGSVVTQIQPDLSRDTDSNTFGYLLALLSCFAAGLGGVISEKLLKGDANSVVDSIHWQNMQLYFFGFALGLGSSIPQMYRSDQVNLNLFDGFNMSAYATVACLTFVGLLVSFVLKYLDNFAKCFVNALTIIVIALVHSGMMHKAVPLKLFVAVVLTCMALEQFNLPQL